MSSLIRGALPLVVSLLSRSFGVEVVWGKYPTASTDGKRIYMPELPLEGAELERWVYGYTVHECGHIRYTDFKVFADAVACGSMVRDLVNIIEDPRIEARTCLDLPGARVWLEDLTEEALKAGLLGEVSETSSPADQVKKWLLYRLGFEVMHYAGLEGMAREQQVLMQSLFPEAEMLELEAAFAQAKAAGSTLDVLDVAMRIAEILRHSSIPEVADEAAWGTITTDRADALQEQIATALEDQRTSAGSRPDGSSNFGLPMVLTTRATVDASQMIQTVRAESRAITARLQEAMEDDVRSHEYAARSGSRLTRDAGLRIARSNYKIFRRVDERREVSASVMLLCDTSRSMERRLQTALKACAAFTVGLESIDGVSTAVSCFPAIVHRGRDTDRNGVYVVKRFDEGYRESLGRLQSVQADGGTPLGRALMHCNDVLSSAKTDRLICIVIGDGQPDSAEQALKARKVGESLGIQFLGIGIGFDMRPLFPESVTIDDAADLGRVLHSLAHQALVADRSRRAA